jgi:hypothetical protein
VPRLKDSILEDLPHTLRLKLQHIALELSAQTERLKEFVTLESQTSESRKTFYLLSLMLLISFIFLAPDKIPQTFQLGRADNVILEKAREIAGILKRLV